MPTGAQYARSGIDRAIPMGQGSSAGRSANTMGRAVRSPGWSVTDAGVIRTQTGSYLKVNINALMKANTGLLCRMPLKTRPVRLWLRKWGEKLPFCFLHTALPIYYFLH